MQKILIGIEIILIAFALIHVFGIVNKFKKTNKQLSTVERIEVTMANAIKNTMIAAIITREIVMLYYLFPGNDKQSQHAQSFSYHRNVGYFGVLLTFVSVILIESIGLFFIIHHWSPLLSWLHIALNVYAFLYLISDYQGIKRNPFTVQEKHVTLRVGFRRKICFSLQNIKEIKDGKNYDKFKKNKDVFIAHLLELDSPQIEIELIEPVITRNLFGKPIPINRVFVTVDHKVEFMRALTTI